MDVEPPKEEDVADGTSHFSFLCPFLLYLYIFLEAAAAATGSSLPIQPSESPSFQFDDIDHPDHPSPLDPPPATTPLLDDDGNIPFGFNVDKFVSSFPPLPAGDGTRHRRSDSTDSLIILQNDQSGNYVVEDHVPMISNRRSKRRFHHFEPEQASGGNSIRLHFLFLLYAKLLFYYRCCCSYGCY